jgi:hypothetical protein
VTWRAAPYFYEARRRVRFILLVTALLIHARLLAVKWWTQSLPTSKLRIAIVVALLMGAALTIGALASLHFDVMRGLGNSLPGTP